MNSIERNHNIGYSGTGYWLYDQDWQLNRHKSTDNVIFPEFKHQKYTFPWNGLSSSVYHPLMSDVTLTRKDSAASIGVV